QAHAEVALVAQVEFGQQVDAVRDQAAPEVQVAVVGVGLHADRVVGDGGIGFFDTPGAAVLDRVVPGHGNVGIAGLELDGGCRGRRKRQDAGSSQGGKS